MPCTTGGGGLTVGLIGANTFATGWHLPAWQRCPDAHVDWVVDTDASRAEKAAQQFDIARTSTDYRELLADESITVVDICTPARTHFEIASAALRAGKHVLLEKPFVTSVEEAHQLAELAANSETVLMVAENWPYSDVAQQVRRLLDEGVLGDLYMVKVLHETAIYAFDGELPIQLRAESSVGGYTLSAGIHSLNLTRFLVGEFEELCAFSDEKGPSEKPFVERNVVIAGRFASGVLTSMNFTGTSRHIGPRRLGFSFFGSKGVLEFDVLAGWVDWTVDGQRTRTERANASMGYDEEIAHFCDCVRTNQLPRTNAVDQLKTIAVVEAVYRSLFQGAVVRPGELVQAAATSGVGGR